MGWWVQNSKFPLHEDMSRANFAKLEKKAVETRKNEPTWGEVIDSISTLPKGPILVFFVSNVSVGK